MDPSLNVYGKPLRACCMSPTTGFFRNGCCDTSKEDMGIHTVCVLLTQDFLEFSKAKGNDLITPKSEFDFPGLVEGDRWCVCADRWLSAYNYSCAAPVILQSTNLDAIKIIDLKILKKFALDLN